MSINKWPGDHVIRDTCACRYARHPPQCLWWNLQWVRKIAEPSSWAALLSFLFVLLQACGNAVANFVGSDFFRERFGSCDCVVRLFHARPLRSTRRRCRQSCVGEHDWSQLWRRLGTRLFWGSIVNGQWRAFCSECTATTCPWKYVLVLIRGRWKRI